MCWKDPHPESALSFENHRVWQNDVPYPTTIWSLTRIILVSPIFSHIYWQHNIAINISNFLWWHIGWCCICSTLWIFEEIGRFTLGLINVYYAFESNLLFVEVCTHRPEALFRTSYTLTIQCIYITQQHL